MRTTVTLDADTEALLRRHMKAKGVSFKVALNDAVRAGLAVPSRLDEAFRTVTSDMGVPAVNLDRALQLAAELEDDELLRRQQVGT
ncbi:MAG: antitoxin [Acidimicrobiia bacterium]